MQFFKCKYLDHEEEKIIGFCLNENCQMATQYCYLCLTNNHINHQKDCFRFVTINQSIDEYIRIQKEFNEKFIEIYSKLKSSITKIFKTIDDDIQILENMKQLLQNEDYLNLKSQIHIIKSYHSQEKAKQFQKQISELNNILNTIQNLFTDQKKEDDQLISKNQNTQIQEVESNQENLQLIEMSKELLNEGKKLWHEGQFQDAIIKFDDSLNLFCENEDVHLWKGFALHILQRFQDAIQCYNIAITINPQNDTTWYYKGFALHRLNIFQEAIDCYDKAITINPQNDNAWSNKGLALHILDKHQDAIECCNKAITINPKNQNAWSNKGLALHKLNLFQEAIDCYDQAIAINPQLEDEWFNKGSVLNSLNKTQAAIKCFDQAVKINPQHQNAWYNKGSALISLNKFQDAIECYDRAIIINPKNDNAWSNKGLALHNLNKFQDAIHCYNQALDLKISPLRLQRKADSLFKLGKKSEARQFYLAALTHGSNEKNYIIKQLSKL